MKLEIYFLNSKLTTEIKKDIQVRDLLFDLKEYLNTADSNFILFDKNHTQLKESDIISIKKEKQLVLYLIKSVPNKNTLTNIEKKDNLTENLKATELIMKCTNANKVLDLRKRIAPNNRITLLDSKNSICYCFDIKSNTVPALDYFDNYPLIPQYIK